MNKELRYFTANRTLFNIAIALFELFGILNLYSIFDENLLYAVGPYIVIHFSYATLLPVFARYVGKMGIRTSMILGSILFLASLSPLIFVTEEIQFPIFIWITLNIAARLVYYLPVHYYFTTMTSSRHRGEEIGIFNAIMLVSVMLIPLIGGNISENYSIAGLAVTSLFILGLSILPLFKLENEKFFYSGRLKRIESVRAVRKMVKLVIVDTIQGQFWVFWVIYVFIVLRGSFVGFGELFTIVGIINAVISVFLGKFLDRHNRKQFLNYDAIFVFVVWILRAIASSTLGILIAETAFKINLNLKNSAFGVLTYDFLSQSNHEVQIDEKIVIREISINYTISLALFAGFIIVTVGGFQLGFVVAGIVALLFAFI
ncbi:MAG: MFS transporter [Candidatus Dojkabacteria bacterium]